MHSKWVVTGQRWIWNSLWMAVVGWGFAASEAPLQAQRVLGLDISAWQGNITQQTWNNIYQIENRQFVFLRASRGGTTGFYNQNNPGNDNPVGQNTLSQRYDDPYYVQNINRATTAGMMAGSYHFSRPDIVATTLNSNGIPNSGTDEANHFMQMAGPWMRPGYLLPVLDLEAGDGARSSNEMAQFTIDFSNRIHDVMGIRPAIYINGNYAHNVLGGASSALRAQVVEAYPTLWSARWPNQSNPNAIDVQNGHPKDSYTNIYGPWDDSGTTHPWDFWQYASTGRLPSFNNGNNNLDFDVSQGDIEFVKDRMVPALWVNDQNGDWGTLDQWNSGQVPQAPVTGPGQVPPIGSQILPTPRLPGAAGTGITSGQHDTVVLDRPNANITVTHTSGSHNVRKLFVHEALEITGGLLAVNYNPTYLSNPQYPNAMRSGPVSAQFSGPVTLGGNGEFRVHTLQVDAAQNFTLEDGRLTFDTIKLMPHASDPARIVVTGDVEFRSLNDATAVIARGSGSGNSGWIDLAAGAREFDVADGAAPVDLIIEVPVANGSLTKTGAGTLALHGANTYTGDTAIEAGVLSLSSAFLDDGSTVYLNTSGALNLNFAGVPDVIDALFIDGIPQPAGDWGSDGSSAPFTSPLLTGGGQLRVMRRVVTGDFDYDGDFDCDDVNGLVVEIVGGTHNVAFDLNGDLFVNGDDLSAWLTTAGAANLPSGGAYLHGDANLDGFVDGSDFNVWNGNKFTAVTAWCAGDFNADGAIDGSDFGLWNGNKFSASDQVVTVPEPGCGVAMLVAGAILFCRRQGAHGAFSARA